MAYNKGRTQKYHFVVRFAAADSNVVRAYVLQHLLDAGYPLDTIPAATDWMAVCADDGKGTERVYGVFGYRLLVDRTADVTDFYVHKSRMGVLAGYAAMEWIKEFCDLSGYSVMTMTPAGNTPMIDAYRRVFGVDSPVRTLQVYRYTPAKTPAGVAA